MAEGDPVNGVKAGIDAVRGPTTSVDGVPPAVLTVARNIALQTNGDTNAVANFMRQQGYPAHAGEWCGDFVSAVVHAAGGTPPAASPVAGAWANFGSPRQGGPQPGDIAIQRGYDARTGSNYTHVTFVDSVNPDGTFVGLGGNQSGGQLTRSTFNSSAYDFRNPTIGPGTTAAKGLDLPADAPNAGQFQPVINAAATKYGISPVWLGRLLYQENLFKPTGTSPAGAQGIAQFMPATAARYGVNVNDPASSIDGAAHYLSDNLKLFNGNVGLASAGYNWGEDKVQSWLQGGKPPPQETRNYVQGITGHSIDEWKAQPAGASNAAPVSIANNVQPTGPGMTGLLGPNLNSSAGWLNLLGQAASQGLGSSGRPQIQEPPDQPAIRMPALSTQLTANSPSPEPSSPSSGLGMTLGALTDTNALAADTNITGGAPSMGSFAPEHAGFSPPMTGVGALNPLSGFPGVPSMTRYSRLS